MLTCNATIEGVKANGNRIWRTKKIVASGWHEMRQAVLKLAADMGVKLVECRVEEEGTGSFMEIKGEGEKREAAPVLALPPPEPTPVPWGVGGEGISRVKWEPVEVRGISHDTVAGRHRDT